MFAKQHGRLFLCWALIASLIGFAAEAAEVGETGYLKGVFTNAANVRLPYRVLAPRTRVVGQHYPLIVFHPDQKEDACRGH